MGGEKGESYYAILGVSERASEQEIKKAYRKRALEVHPDVSPSSAATSTASSAQAAAKEEEEEEEDANEAFRRVTEAYEVLIDGRKRSLYDLSRKQRVKSTNPFKNASAHARKTSEERRERKRNPHEEWREKQQRWQSEYERQQRAREAWEEEKKEAKEYRARALRRKHRVEEAHRIRVGVKLRQFWQTSSGIHKYDVVLVSLVGSCVGMVAGYWTYQSSSSSPSR
mmetsp:Transcript_4710/g.8286  ORF Transcript_4710/g.8286 Transcript_4710/m.8286 type:complete len:226 (-) Transcript_4710:78-755(-)